VGKIAGLNEQRRFVESSTEEVMRRVIYHASDQCGDLSNRKNDGNDAEAVT